MIPVTIGTNGTVSQSFRKYLDNIAGRHEIELQKAATLGAAHLLREVHNVTVHNI